VRHSVAVRGTGRVELPAYGLADAEHQVEKEIRALWPDATADVLDVARADDGSRIVEEFRVRYRVRGAVAVDAESLADARKAALRMLRERFTGSRYERVAWEVVEEGGGTQIPAEGGEPRA
jgi:outer membrane PBP1 activator LpoA protein